MTDTIHEMLAERQLLPPQDPCGVSNCRSASRSAGIARLGTPRSTHAYPKS
ncbi:hypothetical protein [Streptomyces sp. WM6386]|uniref:hypothetical protein n=1 Tax=Streptomyces sp. WM6386 TaxID=1415558 RepID=UPI001F2A99A1|nr:hypothetical protein [Streptomyces sp. WM6386]